MLGGSSSLHFMLYVRGPKEEYDEWSRSVGDNGWNYDSVLPYFKKSEGNQNETLVAYDNERYHNATGPVKVSSYPSTGINLALFESFRAAGVKIIPEINADQTLGYTELQSGSFEGMRSSSAYAFLSPNRYRKNLHVITHAYVNKILMNKNNEIYGVKFTYKGKHKMKAYSKKEVIVSAGTIQSAPLLMRSGIGPRAHLEHRKIKCNVDLPVGDNYIDHVFAHLIFTFDISPEPLGASFELDSLNEYLTKRSGPLAAVPYIVAFEDTTNTTGLPNVQLFLTQYPRGIPDRYIEDINKFTDFDLFNTIMLNAKKYHDLSILTMSLIKPKSRGYIRLNKCPNCKKPTIYTNYLEDPEDRATLISAIKHQIALMNTAPFQAIGTQFVRVPLVECDTLEYMTDAYWECYLKYCTTSGSQQVGTSQMGAVVDSHLKVFHTKRLRQIDAGV